jgi:hypothetical protein
MEVATGIEDGAGEYSGARLKSAGGTPAVPARRRFALQEVDAN